MLFDLDGTLIDTAPDMAEALNALLVEVGRSPLPFEYLRPYVSHGAPGMVKQGFGHDISNDELETRRERFLDIYADFNGRRAKLFDGYVDTLAQIERANCPWGIVTNKPARFSEPLIEQLGIADRMGCLICGDTLTQRKPHPEPLLHAAERLCVPAPQCIYVGDDARDMQAARAAGMAGIIASYGYIPESERPDEWPSAARISKPEELIGVLGLH